MLRVGLTGGIGSGKSTVANLFKQLGVSVIDTDEIAHQISSPDGPAYPAIVEQFGADILSADNTINRKKLAGIVFNTKKRKQQLEAILHPLIWLIVEQQAQEASSPYCIIVVPLLIEGQHQKRFNNILVIDSDESLQIDRATSRDNRSEEDIQAIINNQVSREQRLASADHIIINNDNLSTLNAEVQKLHEEFLLQAGKYNKK